VTYAPDRIHEEVAYVAYHFHWGLDQIIDLEHGQRLRYVQEIARINARMSEER
jgi:transcriptional antiterminator